MKKSLICVIACLTMMVLTSCQNYQTYKDAQQCVAGYLPYLSDNYHVGDSVFFIRESGLTEGFIVTQSEGGVVTQGQSKYQVAYAHSTLTMSNDSMMLFIELKPFPKMRERFVITPRTNSIEPRDRAMEMDLSQEEYTLKYLNYNQTCTIRRNKGIVSIVDGQGRTWKSK